MPTEYAYPEQFWWVNATQRSVLALVVVIFFVPLVREVLRRGALNRIDFILGVTCLIATTMLPMFVVTWLIAALQKQLGRWTGDVLEASGWFTVQETAVVVVWIHVCWLLTWWVSRRNTLKTVLVYMIPIVWFSMPALGHPRSVSHRVACRNNAKQLGLAWDNYHDMASRFPAAVLKAAGAERSWRVEMLPYLDQAPLHHRYDVTVVWDVEPNAALAKNRIEALHCPSNYRPHDTSFRYYTAFAGVVGPNTVFDPDGHIVTVKDVTDGTSSTISFVESCGAQIVWSEPRDLQLDEMQLGVNLPGWRPGNSRGLISSCHPHGGFVGFLDGTVRFVSEDVDPKILKDLLTADGGESILRDGNNEIRWK